MAPVRAPFRIPYTSPLPAPRIIPASASTASGAIAALVEFLDPASHRTSVGSDGRGRALLLTGAGISVASGLADYRGTKGTYTLNKTYRPIYYNEFCENHEARKRYWARSFLGWTSLLKAKPNAGHEAVRRLGQLGIVDSVITQNVDSFHPKAHPSLPTIELHGYLRTLTCLTCKSSYDRNHFQTDLARLNPTWAAFLQEMLAMGALDTENPDERRQRGLKSNPDGDVDIPGAPYTTFRYPACPTCLEKGEKGEKGVAIDEDGAWKEGGVGGVLKPSVVMFGESIPAERKNAAEQAVNYASRVLVIGSSLATYSAWRLVKHAKELGMPIGILNIGGVRGEDTFFADVPENTGKRAVRCSESADVVLPEVVKALEGRTR
ncbi:DHS-like NAD/FAD-binding domain-containing protein [Bimuria novae-zelandiae CBS 107.79]|uniref:DHS-like NAD/FAD-binding domain-containing protein n=1 Tax=Bimuria novae-zelandiae CBS 107.79 TaxID=1447943 RepID=A0A6A5V6F9_9PLEO|nr:DHS-like NAD/FAD-binding domain-containing protein [Bimuria novae-zelandiae CBS 107.79]